jgi:F-type H+-transporting ATPase subunit b
MKCALHRAVWTTVAWVVPACVWASPSADDAGHLDVEPHDAHTGIEWFSPILGNEGKTGLLWILINFVVLMWLLEKLLFSKLRARTREKHDQIKGELEQAQTAREEAEGLVSEYRQRLDRLDTEVEEMMDDAKARAETERHKIIAAARAEAQRIREAADAAAQREAESRRRQIENEIIDRAVARAESMVRKKMTGSDQQRMVEEYVGQLGRVDLGARTGGRA